MGRALGVAITYVIIGALWGQMTSFLNSASLGPFAVIAQIGLGFRSSAAVSGVCTGA